MKTETRNEMHNLLEKLLTIPAGGMNVDDADIHCVLGNGRKIKFVKEEFTGLHSFMSYMETLKIASFGNAKGLLMVITVDPNAFPDMHYITFEQKLKRALGKIGIPCCLGFYRTFYKKEKILVYIIGFY